MNPKLPIEAARNLGPVTGPELASVGIRTVGDLQRLGWERALERWVAAFPNRVHLMAALALAGANEDIDLREISPALRTEVRAAVRRLREEHAHRGRST